MADDLRSYEAPTLTVLGSVEEVTQGNLATGAADNQLFLFLTTP